MKPKDKEKLCYTDTDINHIKTEDFYKDIQMILIKDSIHQIMCSIDHCL